MSKKTIEEVRAILDNKKDEYGTLNFFEIQWYRKYYSQLVKNKKGK